jgi:hypothetical protein
VLKTLDESDVTWPEIFWREIPSLLKAMKAPNFNVEMPEEELFTRQHNEDDFSSVIKKQKNIPDEIKKLIDHGSK